MPRLEHSFWLLPSEPLATRLRGLIAELAAAHDAVAFEPHVTLYCGASDDATTRAALDRISAQFGPAQLVFARLEASEEYAKTLFIRFEESAAARDMSETARRLCANASDYMLNPHLSLIYKRMPEARKRQIMASLELPRGGYVFDRVRAIETEAPLAERDQIRRWRVVGECSLAFNGTIQ